MPLFVVFIISFSSFAQSKEDDGEIENTQIIIEKNKKVVFPEIQRKFELITPPVKKSTNSEPRDYKLNSNYIKAEEFDPKIKISTIKEDNAIDKKRNFIKIGGGNYLTTYLEGQVLTKNHPKYTVGLYAKHFASANGPLKNAGASDNHIKGYATYFAKKIILNSQINYNRIAGNYYGYNQKLVDNGDNQLKDSIYQVYNLLNAKLNIQQADTNLKYIYKANIEYYNTGNKDNSIQENEFVANGMLKYHLDKVSNLNFDLNSSFSTYKNKTEVNRNLVSLRAFYSRYVYQNLWVSGGFSGAYENDTASNTKRIHIYPYVNAEYEVSRKIKAYLTLDGGMDKINYRNRLEKNFFVDGTQPLVHTNRLYEFSIGLKGNLHNYLIFNTKPSIASIRNLALFTNSLTDSSRYSTIYDRGNTTRFSWMNELTFQPNSDLQMGLRFTYNYFETDKIAKPWLIPAYSGAFFTSYNLFNKFLFQFDAFYYGEFYAFNYISNKEYKMKDIIDINFKTNYKFSDRFSVYLYFFNILAQNYQIYNYYPVKGFNVVGGLWYTF